MFTYWNISHTELSKSFFSVRSYSQRLAYFKLITDFLVYVIKWQLFFCSVSKLSQSFVFCLVFCLIEMHKHNLFNKSMLFQSMDAIGLHMIHLCCLPCIVAEELKSLFWLFSKRNKIKPTIQYKINWTFFFQKAFGEFELVIQNYSSR